MSVAGDAVNPLVRRELVGLVIETRTGRTLSALTN